MDIDVDGSQAHLSTIFTTNAPGCWYRNVCTILGRCFKRTYPRLKDSFARTTIELQSGAIKIECIFTKAGKGRKAILAPRCFQFFVNGRPCYPAKKLTAIVQDLYKDFKIPNATFPYFLMHVTLDAKYYDLKVYADMRKFFFKP